MGAEQRSVRGKREKGRDSVGVGVVWGSRRGGGRGEGIEGRRAGWWDGEAGRGGGVERAYEHRNECGISTRGRRECRR